MNVLNYFTPRCTPYWKHNRNNQLLFCWHNVKELCRIYKWMWFSKKQKAIEHALGVECKIEVRFKWDNR